MTELSKSNNKSKGANMGTFNTANIEETLKHGGSLKATRRKLTVGKNAINALRHARDETKNNIDDILK